MPEFTRTHDAFMGAWLVCWVACEVILVQAWLWTAFGEERVSVRSGLLAIAKRFAGHAFAESRYPIASVLHLEVRPSRLPVQAADLMRSWEVNGGGVQFEDSHRTVRFGAGLSAAEAEMVLEELKRGLPGTWQAHQADGHGVVIRREAPGRSLCA